MILKSKRKKNMAKSYSLEELQSRYSTLKGLKTKADKKREASINAYETAQSELENSNNEVKNITLRKEGFEKILSSYEENTPEYKKAKKEYDKVSKELETAEAEQQKNQTAFDTAKTTLETLRTQYADLDQELQVIRISFARDPRINQVLKESLETEYDKKIRGQSNLVEFTKNQSIDLTNAMKNDPTLSDLATKLKEAFAEKSKYSAYSTEPEAAKANQAYADAATALRNAVKGMENFKTVELTDNDLGAIITDQPVLTEEIAKQEQIKTDLEAKKVRVLASIEAAKTASTGSKEELENQKTEKENEIAQVESEITQADTNISNVETELQGLGYDLSTIDLDAAIAQLEIDIQNADIPDGLTPEEEQELQDLENKDSSVDTTEVENAQRANDAAKKSLTDSGYITPEAIEALGIDGFEDLYKEFFDLDRELRKKFLEIKGTEIEDKDNSDEIKSLDEAIKNYQDKARELSGKTGFSVEALQDYLLRDVAERIDNKDDGFEEIPEEYATGLAEARFEKFAKDSTLYDDEIEDLRDNLDKLSEQEKAILAGKDPKAYKTELGKYIDNVNDLDENEKSSFFSTMKSSLTQVAKGFWDKLKGFFSKTANKIKSKFEPDLKEEPEGYEDLLSNVQKTGEDLTAAKDALGDSALTPEEEARMQELIDKSNGNVKASRDKSKLESTMQKLETLKAERARREALTDQKGILEGDRDLIQAQIDNSPVLEDIEITDSGAIHDTKGTLYKDVRSSFDEER